MLLKLRKEKIQVQSIRYKFVILILILFICSNCYTVDFSNYRIILKARKNVSEVNSVSRMLVDELKENPDQNIYEFIKYLKKTSDQNAKIFESAILILLEDLMKGKVKLQNEAIKIVKKRLLFLLSRTSLTGDKIDIQKKPAKKSGIYVYFPFIRNSSYRANASNITSLIREKTIEFLDNTSKFIVIHDKVSALRNKENIDYILDVTMHQYEFSVRNHFDRYIDDDDRSYYRYDYSDLDMDIRIDIKLIKYSSGKVVNRKRGFFSKTGTLHLYPGDSRFYGDVPYYWRENQGMSIYDEHRSNLHDYRYNPYFNDFDETVKSVIEDIIFDKREGIVKFLIDTFPIKSRIIRLDKNPDYAWINTGKNDGVYHKLRFSILKGNGKTLDEKAVLRARTIKDKISRCRIHRFKNIDYSPKIGDKVISSGY